MGYKVAKNFDTDVYARKKIEEKDSNYHDTDFNVQELIDMAIGLDIEPKDLKFTAELDRGYYGDYSVRLLYSYSRLETDKEYNERIKKHEEKLVRKKSPKDQAAINKKRKETLARKKKEKEDAAREQLLEIKKKHPDMFKELTKDEFGFQSIRENY